MAGRSSRRQRTEASGLRRTWRTLASCEGIARFDGTTLVRHLRDVCVYAFDIAPDGSVWVQASGPPTATGAGQIETYVITPEAVAATE